MLNDEKAIQLIVNDLGKLLVGRSRLPGACQHIICLKYRYNIPSKSELHILYLITTNIAVVRYLFAHMQMCFRCENG